jgi:hypothetical protein
MIYKSFFMLHIYIQIHRFQQNFEAQIAAIYIFIKLLLIKTIC